MAKISGSNENEQLKVDSYIENSSLIDVVAWVKVRTSLKFRVGTCMPTEMFLELATNNYEIMVTI